MSRSGERRTWDSDAPIERRRTDSARPGDPDRRVQRRRDLDRIGSARLPEPGGGVGAEPDGDLPGIPRKRGGPGGILAAEGGGVAGDAGCEAERRTPGLRRPAPAGAAPRHDHPEHRRPASEIGNPRRPGAGASRNHGFGGLPRLRNARPDGSGRPPGCGRGEGPALSEVRRVAETGHRLVRAAAVVRDARRGATGRPAVRPAAGGRLVACGGAGGVPSPAGEASGHREPGADAPGPLRRCGGARGNRRRPPRSGSFRYHTAWAISRKRQKAFASRICQGVRHSGKNNSGLATTVARQRAREVATFSRLSE